MSGHSGKRALGGLGLYQGEESSGERRGKRGRGGGRGGGEEEKEQGWGWGGGGGSALPARLAAGSTSSACGLCMAPSPGSALLEPCPPGALGEVDIGVPSGTGRAWAAKLGKRPPGGVDKKQPLAVTAMGTKGCAASGEVHSATRLLRVGARVGSGVGLC